MITIDYRDPNTKKFKKIKINYWHEGLDSEIAGDPVLRRAFEYAALAGIRQAAKFVVENKEEIYYQDEYTKKLSEEVLSYL